MNAARLVDHTLLLLCVLGAALAVLRREQVVPSASARWALRSAATAWLLLWIAATPAFSAALVRSLEPALPAPEAAVPMALAPSTALVVLGSSVGPAVPGIPSSERLDGAARARVLGAARWFHATHPAAVIVTGVAPGPDPGASAAAMTDLLVASGVPRGQVWLEPRAANTRENARFSVALGRARGITRFVVVTSALHMRRSMAEFLRAGVDPVAAPVDFVGPGFGGAGDWLPAAGSLGRTQQCLHEYAGLLKP